MDAEPVIGDTMDAVDTDEGIELDAAALHPSETGADDAHTDTLGDTTSLKLLVTNSQASAVIGKRGAQIRLVQSSTGAKVKIANGDDCFPGTSDRAVMVTGSLQAVSAAVDMLLTRLFTELSASTRVAASETLTLLIKVVIPSAAAGLLIGKRGDNMKALRATTGATIQLLSRDQHPFNSVERYVTVIGSLEQVQAAVRAVFELLRSDPERCAYTHPTVSYTSLTPSAPAAPPQPHWPAVPPYSPYVYVAPFPGTPHISPNTVSAPFFAMSSPQLPQPGVPASTGPTPAITAHDDASAVVLGPVPSHRIRVSTTAAAPENAYPLAHGSQAGKGVPGDWSDGITPSSAQSTPMFDSTEPVVTPIAGSGSGGHSYTQKWSSAPPYTPTAASAGPAPVAYAYPVMHQATGATTYAYPQQYQYAYPPRPGPSGGGVPTAYDAAAAHWALAGSVSPVSYHGAPRVPWSPHSPHPHSGGRGFGGMSTPPHTGSTGTPHAATSASPASPHVHGHCVNRLCERGCVCTSESMDVPEMVVGAVFGKGGSSLRWLQLHTKTKITLSTRSSDATRHVLIVGAASSIARAKEVIQTRTGEAQRSYRSGATLQTTPVLATTAADE